MGIEFIEHPENGYFVSKFTGGISDDLLLTSYKEYYHTHNWHGQLNELADLSVADFSGLTSNGMRLLIEYTEKYCKEKGIDEFFTAVYAPNDLPFGMARMYQAMAEVSPENLQVFRELSRAEEWLIEHKA